MSFLKQVWLKIISIKHTLCLQIHSKFCFLCAVCTTLRDRQKVRFLFFAFLNGFFKKFRILFCRIISYLNKRPESLIFMLYVVYKDMLPFLKKMYLTLTPRLVIINTEEQGINNLLIYVVIHFITIFLMIAYYTLLERKIMASVQRRKGPNVNGFQGLLQPLADGGKLLLKEMIIPKGADRFLFIASPVFFFNYCFIIMDFNTF